MTTRFYLILGMLMLSLHLMAGDCADFYRVEASKGIKAYEDRESNKVRYTFKKGQIMEITYRYDELVNDRQACIARVYVTDEERNKYLKQGYDVSDWNQLKDRKSGLLIGGTIYFNENELSPIDPPDSEALERHKLGEWDQFWTPFYEPFLLAVIVFCAILILFSLFRLKIIRVAIVSVIAFFGAISFYGFHANSYWCMVLLPAAMFMPIAYANLLFPWKTCAIKELALTVICVAASVFTFVYSFLYLRILWDGWFFISIAGLIATFIVLVMVIFAGPLSIGHVCPECGYYGKQKSIKRSEIVDQSFSTQIETTEYRRTSDNTLDHTDVDTTELEHITRRFFRRCGHCGYEYSYERSVTFSGPTHRETTRHRW